MAIALAVLSRIWPYLLGAALLVGGWLYLDRACWSSACRSERTQNENLRSQIAAAHERATALALLWAKEVDNVKVRYAEVVKERSQAFAGIRDGARQVRPATDSVVVRVPADALVVLNDASRAANPAAASGDQGPAQAVPQAARDTTLTEWIAFATDAAEAYRDAADKHLACVAAYEAVATRATTDH